MRERYRVWIVHCIDHYPQCWPIDPGKTRSSHQRPPNFRGASQRHWWTHAVRWRPTSAQGEEEAFQTGSCFWVIRRPLVRGDHCDYPVCLFSLVFMNQAPRDLTPVQKRSMRPAQVLLRPVRFQAILLTPRDSNCQGRYLYPARNSRKTMTLFDSGVD